MRVGKIKKYNKGQSLFEVVMAVCIVALMLSGIVALATVSVRNSSYSKNNTIATKYAQEVMEWLRLQRDQDWTGFLSHASTGSGKTTCLDSEPLSSWGPTITPCPQITSTIFSRLVTLKTDGSGNIATATAEVNWTDGEGTHEVTTETTFTNWNK